MTRALVKRRTFRDTNTGDSNIKMKAEVEVMELHMKEQQEFQSTTRS